ncbi:tandem-95 repeat protein, partial [Marinomonas epiphytica]
TVSNPVLDSGQGSVQVSDNKIVYTPALNFNGEAQISYTISDGNGGSDTATVRVTVSPVNDSPVASDSSADARSGISTVLDVLSNASDIEDNTLMVSNPSLVSGSGSVSIENNKLVFTPDSSFIGNAVIDYQVVDSEGGSDTGSITVTVTENHTPVANDVSVSSNEDTTVVINVLEQASDANGDSLSVSEAALVSGQGSVSIENGNIIFTPAENYNGSVQITYMVVDQYGASDSATVSLDVEPVNDQPEVGSSTGSATAGNSVTIDVLAAADDAEGDELTLSNPILISGEGEVSVSDNKIVYEPDENFSGQAVIQYTVTDSNGASTTATITINVTGNAPTLLNDQSVNLNFIEQVLNRTDNFSYQAIDYDPVLLDAVNSISLLPTQADVSANQPNLNVINNFSVFEAADQLDTLADIDTGNNFDLSEPLNLEDNPNIENDTNEQEEFTDPESLQSPANEESELVNIQGQEYLQRTNNSGFSNELEIISNQQLEELKALRDMLA